MLVIGSCGTGELGVYSWRGINMLHFRSGTAGKASPKESASRETLLIARQIKLLVQDSGVPSDVRALPSLLFGNNPQHEIYLNADAFKVNQSGQICDEGGRPYLITMKDGTMTVESVTYSVSANESY